VGAMFTKIHLAFYDILFEIYGKLCKYYLAKSKKDEARWQYWEEKADECIDKRSDILIIMCTLKGLY
jgi:hypothetical protein